MKADGTNQHNLTESEAVDYQPPGRRTVRIAFTSFRTAMRGVRDEADGTHQRNLTRWPGNNFTPNWSPDGTQIAFGREIGHNLEIFVMKANGQDSATCPIFPGPTFSPCGRPMGR